MRAATLPPPPPLPTPPLPQAVCSAPAPSRNSEAQPAHQPQVYLSPSLATMLGHTPHLPPPPRTHREMYHVHSVEDADPQGHEGLGEVDDFLPLSGDGEGCHSQVCLLLEGKQVGQREGDTRQGWAVRHPQPLPGVRAEAGPSSVPAPLARPLLTTLCQVHCSGPAFVLSRESPILLRLALNSLYS